MLDHPLFAVAFAVLLWWSATAALLRLSRAQGADAGSAMAAMTALAVAAVIALDAVAARTDAVALYLGFAAGVAVWGWHELAFLYGYGAGGHRGACPPDVTTGRRFTLAFLALWRHEVALAVTAIALLAWTWGAPNAVGAQVFAALWLLRISAKLNVFCGAPHITQEFLPARLDHLMSYCGPARRPTWVFALSVTLGTLACGALIWAAVTATALDARLAASLLGAMVALGVLEHWFLVLPTPDAALWRWALPRGDAGRRPMAARLRFTLPATVGGRPAPHELETRR